MTKTLELDGQGDPRWPDDKDAYADAMLEAAQAGPPPLRLWPADAEAVLAAIERGEAYVPTEGPAMEAIRRGLLPLMPLAELLAVRQALADDDRNLIQGQTTEPLPQMALLGEPVEAACLTAYGLWKAGAATVGAVEDAFARRSVEIDRRLGWPGCWLIFNWWDHTPREAARAKLLEVFDEEIQARESLALMAGG